MRPVEVKSCEERTLWRLRNIELGLHKKSRPNYYPFDMDKWEVKGKEIVYNYNIQLQELNKKRNLIEKEHQLKMNQAAEHQSKERLSRTRETRRLNSLKLKEQPLRRSVRLANKVE